jgi:hypothetical protein
MALAVIIYQPTPETYDFASLPFYYLSKLESSYFATTKDCELCKQGIPADKVWV